MVLSWKQKRAEVALEQKLFNFVLASRPLLSSAIVVVVYIIAKNFTKNTNTAAIFAYGTFFLVTLAFSTRHVGSIFFGKLTWQRFIVLSCACAVATSVYPLLSRGIVSVLCNAISNACTRSLLQSSVRPTMLMSLFLAPYAETLIVNGWIQTVVARFARRFSIGAAAFIFVVPHFSLNLAIVIAGAAFAMIRARTKSLGLVFTTHVLTNLAIAVFDK